MLKMVLNTHIVIGILVIGNHFVITNCIVHEYLTFIVVLGIQKNVNY